MTESELNTINRARMHVYLIAFLILAIFTVLSALLRH